MSSYTFHLRRGFAAGISLAMLLAIIVVSSPAEGVDVIPIYEIQGAGHLSDHEGDTVTTTGVVTAVGFDNFWVQDPAGDGDDATSDGLFVFDQRSGVLDSLSVGTCVELTDRVDERIAGGAATGNLSTTQMAFPAVTIIPSCTWTVPDPVVIGLSGRVAPNVIVISEDELPVNLQDDPGVFNPDTDGIDFYESLEGMLVTVESPQAVSATRQFGTFSSEFFVLPNNGVPPVIAPVDALTERGGIALQPDPENLGDQNPERVQIELTGTLYPGDFFPTTPSVTVGDRFTDITGLVGYSFGNFEIHAITELVITPGGNAAEVSGIAPTKSSVTVGSYNVLNLSADGSDDDQLALLGSQITNNLNAPDVLALQEIQDNDGATDNGETSADLTLAALVAAVEAAGGPTYEAFDVAPADGSSGGVPGGNIRNAFLYNPDRVTLIDFESLTPDALADYGVGNPNAFDGTRDPLLATFKYRGKEFTVINNHFSSRFGSTPIFGGPQPFVQAGETERGAQTTALNEVVDARLAADKGQGHDASKSGRIMVVGDMNTFEWTNELAEILPGTGGDRVLTNLITGLDESPYTFIFDGNSQALDHFFVTDDLLDGVQFDIVHLNVDFPRRFVDTTGSDHEALLASIKLKP